MIEVGKWFSRVSGLVLGLFLTGASATAVAFDFDSVVAIARERAAEPYEAPRATVPDRLGAADYDAYRKLRFRSDRALWREEGPFEVQFFHLGFLFRSPIRIHAVEGGEARPVPFDSGMFEYGDTGLEQDAGTDIGFAGFRVHYPLHGPDYKDELIVFLGASYFRVLGREQTFGLSARGLAVDTARPEGEEFPIFRDFWLVKPAADDSRLTLYALLDSPSIAGAYRFEIEPGTDTRLTVAARLFAREDIGRLGIAPLTSMHLHGENRTERFDDFRPEVHDSDTLLMQSGDDRWLSRPLVNPGSLRVSHFVDVDPKGFGLFQRDRRFESYQDTEADYHNRPSYWVEPLGAWGEGGVELVEIPVDEEIHDNIVAFWVPNRPVRAGDALSFDYVLTSTLRSPAGLVLGRAVDTRVGAARVPGTDEKPDPRKRRFVVDFAEGDLPLLGDDQVLTPDLVHSAGTIADLKVERLPENDVWRASFRLDMERDDIVELALTLRLDGEAVTETWMYRVGD